MARWILSQVFIIWFLVFVLHCSESGLLNKLFIINTRRLSLCMSFNVEGLLVTTVKLVLRFINTLAAAFKDYSLRRQFNLIISYC